MSKQLLTTLQVLSEAQSLFDSEKVNNTLKKMDRFEEFLKRFGSLEHLINSYSKLEKLLYTSKEFLSVNETAKYLSLSISRVYKLAENREVAHYKPNGKNVYFLRADLDSWIRTGRIFSSEEIERNASLAASEYMMQNRNSKRGGMA